MTVGMAGAWNAVWNVWRSAGSDLMVTKRAKAQKVKASHGKKAGEGGETAKCMDPA
jgi:hypothetical protein